MRNPRGTVPILLHVFGASFGLLRIATEQSLRRVKMSIKSVVVVSTGYGRSGFTVTSLRPSGAPSRLIMIPFSARAVKGLLQTFSVPPT